MKILINEKLSEHKYKTPEGYLICVDSVLARTGKQTYRRNEVFGDSDDDSEIEVDRPAKEVFSDATLASFENKPITVEHPDEDVNAENYKDYAVGFVRDVHKGVDNGMDVIVGTLVITDAKTIEEIENGEHTDLSCGYDCDITDEENPQQRNIRGNHVALCAQGRAGNARIVDTAVKDEKMPLDALRFIMRRVDMYSTQMRNNIDVNKIIRKIEEDGRREGYSIKFKQEKVGDWEKGNVKNSKDYVFGVDGYSNKLQISIYADPKTGKINEMSGFVKDSEFNDGKLPASLKKDIQRILAAKSTYTKYDLDISDIVRDIERYMKVSGHPIKLIRKKIVGWNKMGDGMMRKDYFFYVEGYSNEIMISLYADPNTWKTTEVNGYFTDSINDEEETMKDAMSKQEAINIIKKMIVNPKYAHESYDGITYLTPEATSKIAQIAKEAGLTRKDLESIDSFMFGRAGYNIVDEEMKDAMSKSEAIQKIKNIVKSKDSRYIQEDRYEGVMYLTREGTAKISEIAKSGGLNRKDMENIDWALFGPGGYYTLADDKVKDEFFSDATQIKNIDKGYAILLRRVWDKRGEQAYAERWTDDIEEARRLKSTLERNDGFQFVIVQCHSTPKKVVDEETVLEMAEKYEKTPEIFEEETGPDMGDVDFNDAQHTYEIKWMDIYAKSKGWADYKHHDKIKAGTLREALEKLGNSAGFGIGTNNMLIVNIHRDDGRTYTYTDRLANLMKKTDLADEDSVKDAKQLPNTAELTKIERMLSDAGLLIVQIKYGSTSYAYNLKPKGSIFTEYKGSDAKVYQRKLAKIKNEVENTYGYPVTYNVVETIPGRLVITFAVNAKNTKDAVEDADSFTYKGIFVAKLPHAWRFTLKGKTYEVATDKKQKK